MTYSELKRASLLLIKAVSACVIALGLIVVCGWIFHLPAVVQLLQKSAPMQFNTALCFVLSGVALLFLSFQKFAVTQTLSALVFLLSMAVVFQYILSTDLGVDRLFIEPFTTDLTFYPGRMSINTAVCFTISQVGLFLLTIRQISIRNWISGGCSAVVLACALSTLLGYLLNFEEMYGWNDQGYMAIHTALGFILLEVGALIYAFYLTSIEQFLGWVFFILMMGALAFALSLIEGLFLASRTNLILESQFQFAEISLFLLYLFTLVLTVYIFCRFMKSNRRVATMKEEIEANQATRNSVLRFLSHEIKNPLNAVFGFSELLIEEKEINQAHKYAENIHTAADHVIRLVENLLSYSRYEIGKIELNPTAFDTKEWLDQLRSFLSRRASIAQVHLDIHMGPEVPATLICDKEKLTQIVYNITENAISHSPQGKTVHLSLQHVAPNLNVRVRDHGPGISHADQGRLAEAFYQINDKTKQPGAGIGLLLCKTFVEMMEGSIYLTSEPGHGVEISCTVKCDTEENRGDANCDR